MPKVGARTLSATLDAMEAFLITTVVVIVAVVLIYLGVKKWFQEDYDEEVSGKPSALYDSDIPDEEFNE